MQRVLTVAMSVPMKCLRSFFEALLGPLNARLQSLCRVVGYEVKSNSVAFLLSRVERLCRTFLHSGFTADTIIESTYRHGLLQVSPLTCPHSLCPQLTATNPSHATVRRLRTRA